MIEHRTKELPAIKSYFSQLIPEHWTRTPLAEVVKSPPKLFTMSDENVVMLDVILQNMQKLEDHISATKKRLREGEKRKSVMLIREGGISETGHMVDIMTLPLLTSVLMCISIGL